jgi:3-deoxy-D-manno-octulosonic-acid transferase
MILWLYNLVLLPILFPYLAWRLLVRGKSREGLAERFGKVPGLGPPPPEGRVWVHAVSVGETVAAAPVVAALRTALPGAAILVSTTTPTGQAQARRAFPDAALHFYFPLDLPWVARRVLQRIRPSAIVLMEAEIWPNLLAAAQRRGVPVIVANAHLSDRTLRRAKCLRALLAPITAGITRYLTQSPAIRERALALGLPAERVTVMGHTKFDQAVPSLTPGEAADLRARLGLAPDQPLFLAGSTHEGEEELILDAWEAARRAVPDLALMLAPRHLTRVAAVRTLIERRGLAVITRSGVQAFGCSAGPDDRGPGSVGLNARTPERLSAVLLLDTMGELAKFYGLAAVAFVGGSLVPRGGHDVLQPLFHGVPTLFGPHMHNQRTLVELALEAGAAGQVADPAALTGALVELLSDGDARAAMRAAAARLLAENRGASARCAAVVADLVRP